MEEQNKIKKGMPLWLSIVLIIVIAGLATGGTWYVMTVNLLSQVDKLTKESKENMEVAQLEPAQGAKDVDLNSQEVITTDITKMLPVVQKDPNQKQEFKEKDYGFSFSYPGSWSFQPCGMSTTNYSFYAVLLSPEKNPLPKWSVGQKLPESAQIVLSTNYSASYYSKDYPNYYDDVKKDTGYYTSHTWKNVQINGKQMLRTETTWSGAGGLIPAGTKTVEYHYVDSGKDRLFKATYWLRSTDTDHLQEFENLIKTLNIDM